MSRNHTITLEISENVYLEIFTAMRLTGDDLSTYFRRALGTYRFALNAHMDGKTVGYASSSDGPMEAVLTNIGRD